MPIWTHVVFTLFSHLAALVWTKTETHANIKRLKIKKNNNVQPDWNKLEQLENQKNSEAFFSLCLALHSREIVSLSTIQCIHIINIYSISIVKSHYYMSVASFCTSVLLYIMYTSSPRKILAVYKDNAPHPCSFSIFLCYYSSILLYHVCSSWGVCILM